MSTLSVQDLCIPPDGGEETASDMLIKARSTALGGDFSIMHGEVRPHELLAPHTHDNEDQAVFVITGELEFEVGGRDGLRFSAGPGSWVLKPRGISHGFWNVKDTTVQYVELSGRDGFEQFVDARQDGLLSMVMTGQRELGISFHAERIPELMAKHGLTGLAGINTDDLPKLKLPKLPGRG